MSSWFSRLERRQRTRDVRIVAVSSPDLYSLLFISLPIISSWISSISCVDWNLPTTIESLQLGKMWKIRLATLAKFKQIMNYLHVLIIQKKVQTIPKLLLTLTLLLKSAQHLKKKTDNQKICVYTTILHIIFMPLFLVEYLLDPWKRYNTSIC